jgi:hypothetical protein
VLLLNRQTAVSPKAKKLAHQKINDKNVLLPLASKAVMIVFLTGVSNPVNSKDLSI